MHASALSLKISLNKQITRFEAFSVILKVNFIEKFTNELFLRGTTIVEDKLEEPTIVLKSIG